MNRWARYLSCSLVTATFSAAFVPALAASHREGPFIAGMPKVDGTDFYMFRSYDPQRPNMVTVIANYIPFQDPQGGPNFYQFDPNALYEIHLNNDGGTTESLTFQFRFKSTLKNSPLTVGAKQVGIPLINSGPISEVNDPKLNVRETYTLDLVRGARRGGATTRLTNAAGGEFDKPVDNIGDKTFGGPSGYEAYANKHIYEFAIPNCATTGRVFVGQRKESFYIAVGKIFDLINLNPLGAETGGNPNDLENKNISTLALELPVDCVKGTAVTATGDPVIGAYTTASVRQVRLINPTPTGIDRAAREGGPWAQVSRLGMPLVNEVVIGMNDKDRFNSSRPAGDAQFLDYVTNPTLPALIQSLFPSAPAPTNFPRTDLVEVFLKGLAPLNQATNVTPSDMLRLNLAVPPVAPGAQNPLGVAAGDNAGFPNGRRPADDVVDVALRVSMGALCVLTGAQDLLKVGCNAAAAPAGAAALTDGVRKTANDYKATFPYLNTPLPGNRGGNAQ